MSIYSFVFNTICFILSFYNLIFNNGYVENPVYKISEYLTSRSHELEPIRAGSDIPLELIKWNRKKWWPCICLITIVLSQFQSLQVNLQLQVSQVVNASQETQQRIHDC